MEDAAGDLKQALPNVCDSVQIHVEVHQKSSRSLIRALLAATCACLLSALFYALPRARSSAFSALPGVSSPVSFPKIEQIHFTQFHLVGRVIHSHNVGHVLGLPQFILVSFVSVLPTAHSTPDVVSQSQWMETLAFPNICRLGSTALNKVVLMCSRDTLDLLPTCPPTGLFLQNSLSSSWPLICSVSWAVDGEISCLPLLNVKSFQSNHIANLQRSL